MKRSSSVRIQDCREKSRNVYLLDLTDMTLEGDLQIWGRPPVYMLTAASVAASHALSHVSPQTEP